MDKKGFKKGDEVEVIGTGFIIEIEGFTEIGDQTMIQTHYGDFNIDLIKLVDNENS